jgi:hypothetical protein
MVLIGYRGAEMVWAFLALLAGITNCIQIEINRHYRFNGFELNAYRSLISALLLLPFIPLMEWPSDPRYYLAVLLSAVISVVGMMVQYNLAAAKNGRVANLHQPITIFLTFCMWLMLDQRQLDFVTSHPLNLLGILFSFVLLFISVQFVRKNDAGWRALMAILPVGVLYAFLGIITKLVLDQGAAQSTSLLPISLGFVLLSNIMMAAISFPVVISRKLKAQHSFNKAILKPALYVSAFHTVSWVLINLSTILTPNAAYPFAITALSPLWFMFYYKLKGVKDDASPYAGGLMFAAAVILVLVSKA